MFTAETTAPTKAATPTVVIAATTVHRAAATFRAAATVSEFSSRHTPNNSQDNQPNDDIRQSMTPWRCRNIASDRSKDKDQEEPNIQTVEDFA